MVIFISVLWLASIFLCAFLADEQGRNIWFWIAMGILFGFFAVLYLLVFAKDPVK